MAILGPRVNKWKVPFALDMSAKMMEFGQVAKRVMDRPWTVLIPVLILLLGAGLLSCMQNSPCHHGRLYLGRRITSRNGIN